MVLFRARDGALAEQFPEARNGDARRHAFAVQVLGDEAKGSSKTWTVADYKRISDALELIQVADEK
jgi:hypothetical protein